MTRLINRRDFLIRTAVGGAAAALSSCVKSEKVVGSSDSLFEISLAQWSLHRALRAGELNNLDFAVTAKGLGIDAVEYVNQFFSEKIKGKPEDALYLKEMKSRAEDAGVKSLLIMIDREGHLGDPDEAKRNQAVENHYKWVEAAKFLGCHSIRVNAHSSGTRDEQRSRAADGLSRLTEFGAEHDINVIVENHGGLSSDGSWLASVIRLVGSKYCGTLPDFGNFHLGGGEWYDRYKGVEELMPYAKGVSAKSHDFDDLGIEVNTDYVGMLRIVLAAGYRGYIGIEYEGDHLSEMDGIRATKRLLVKTRRHLSEAFA